MDVLLLVDHVFVIAGYARVDPEFSRIVKPMPVAREALKLMGLVGKGTERDRRPTQDEPDGSSRISTAILGRPSR